MKWLMLLALVACTSKPTSTPTESDAKVVTPTQVRSCLCNKIYMPVCADGIDYGNSCEAECHGHKKWTEGNCPRKK